MAIFFQAWGAMLSGLLHETGAQCRFCRPPSANQMTLLGCCTVITGRAFTLGLRAYEIVQDRLDHYINLGAVAGNVSSVHSSPGFYIDTGNVCNSLPPSCITPPPLRSLKSTMVIS